MSHPIDWVLLTKASELTGYSVKALTRKIQKGELLEGREYKYGPDCHLLICLSGFEKWLKQSSRRRRRVSKSIEGASASAST
jgi:hypothetical protein